MREKWKYKEKNVEGCTDSLHVILIKCEYDNNECEYINDNNVTVKVLFLNLGTIVKII